MTRLDNISFSLTFQKTDETVLEVSLNGSLTEESVGEFREALEQSQAENCVRLVLNCDKLDFLSSAGLSALVAIFHQRKRRGQEFGLCRVPLVIRKILRLTRLDKHLIVFDSEPIPED